MGGLVGEGSNGPARRRARWRKEEERGDHIAAADTSPTSVPASPQCAHHQTEYCTLHTWHT